MLSKQGWVDGSTVHTHTYIVSLTNAKLTPEASHGQGRRSSEMMSYMFTTRISVNTSVKAVCSAKHIVVLQDVLQVFVKSRLQKEVKQVNVRPH